MKSNFRPNFVGPKYSSALIDKISGRRKFGNIFRRIFWVDDEYFRPTNIFGRRIFSADEYFRPTNIFGRRIFSADEYFGPTKFGPIYMKTIRINLGIADARETVSTIRCSLYKVLSREMFNQDHRYPLYFNSLNVLI